jgi:hypothetical protein
MSSRIFAILTVGVLSTLSAVSAVGPSQPMHLRPNAPGNAVLHVAGSRSVQQRNSASGSKFDASLAPCEQPSSGIGAAGLARIESGGEIQPARQQFFTSGADRCDHQG